MMKNMWISVPLLTMSLLLSACGDRPVPPETENSLPPVQTEQAEPAGPSKTEGVEKPKTAAYDDSLIEEYYTDQDSYTEEYEGNSFTTEYEFHIPRLLADTEDAGAINARIEEQFGSRARETRQQLEEEGWCYYLDISWETHWKDSVVSLVVAGETGQTLMEYGVYNYDFETGKEVSNQELLKLAGVSEEDFLTGLRRSAAREFDRMLIEVDPEYSWGLLDMRASTLSDTNLNMEQLMYLDENGTLNAVTEISVPAGGGWYVTVLKPELDWRQGPEKKADCEFVHAELKNGEVTVSFTKTGEAEHYLPEDVEFDRPYPVDGLYGTYTDLYLGVMGQDFFPHLLLLDDQGGVTFCDIIGDMEYGALYSPGPLVGIHDVTSFKSGTVSDDGGGYQTVFGIKKDGTENDLAEYVTAVQYGTPNYMEGMSWVSQDMSSCLTFLPDGVLQLSESRDGEATLSCDGSLTCLGINEKGFILGYRFWGDREINGHGSFYISYGNPDGELLLHVLSGDPLMGVEPGESGVFAASYG